MTTDDIRPSKSSGSSQSISVETIDAEVHFESETFEATSIEVERSKTKDANYAKIKGIFTHGNVPDEGDRTRVRINGNLIFTGEAVRATRNHNHVYTVEAYDHTRTMNQIKENVSTGVFLNYNAYMARRLLYRNGVPNDIQRATGQYRGDNGPTQHEYENRSLSYILDDIAKRLDAYWWVDEHNVVKMRPDPPVGWHYLDRIKEISLGDGQAAGNQVVVFGGAPTSEEGQEAATMYAHNQIKSSARITYGDEEDKRIKEFKVKDQNLTTQAEVEAFMNSKIGEFAEDLKEGKVTIVGDETITPFDTVYVPEDANLDDTIQGEYMAQVVRHKVDAQNGYVTEIELGMSHEDTRDVIDNAKPEKRNLTEEDMEALNSYGANA